MNFTMSSEIVDKLHKLLATEDDDSVVRVRETKIGTPCKARTVLRLSIDTREDDDVDAEVENMHFVMNEELVAQYGTDFTVTLDEDQAFDVKPVQQFS
jgi:hypothetical protein